jgi:hypothetical protein
VDHGGKSLENIRDIKSESESGIKYIIPFNSDQIGLMPHFIHL